MGFHIALYSTLCFHTLLYCIGMHYTTTLHHTSTLHYTTPILYYFCSLHCLGSVLSKNEPPLLATASRLMPAAVHYCSLLFPTVPLQGTIYCQVLPFYCQIGYGKGTRFESTQPKSVLRLLALKPSPPATGSLHFGLSNIWKRLQCTLLWLL